MQTKNNQRTDLHERIFRWIISVLKLLKTVNKDVISIVIIQQLAKSCTSVGANDQEAVTSSSDKDFVSKYQIVKKELSESIYWLRILKEMYPDIDISSQLNESIELLRIISKIILNVKNR
ncbi:four helix bundle protein [Candidatus Collierbacteria bacterium]|nr:four helix bundle protein [Candidatus Collierbacteria bacterium]